MSDPLNIRNDYGKSKLEEANLPGNPMDLFEKWLKEAFNVDMPEPTAMTLATSDENGKVSSRIVLLKGFEDRGFLFYTNYNSRKGRNLNENNYAALSVYWPELEQQVRIEGVVEKLPEKESDHYHAARPRNNQLGAWASEQSEPVKDRYTLEVQYAAVNKAYKKHSVIPRPSHWGGYVLIPENIEFWQGRENRLHDRIEYKRNSRKEDWSIRRLNP